MDERERKKNVNNMHANALWLMVLVAESLQGCSDDRRNAFFGFEWRKKMLIFMVIIMFTT